MKGRARLLLITLVVLATGVMAVLVVLTAGAVRQVDRTLRTKARTLAHTIVNSIRGVVRYGPDREGRVYAILDEISRDPQVLTIGILKQDGTPVVVRGKPLPKMKLSGFPDSETFREYGGGLALFSLFKIPRGCMPPGSCRCKGVVCKCPQGALWAVAPGKYRLALVMDKGGAKTMRNHILMEAAFAALFLVLLVTVVLLLVRSLRVREELSRHVALEQQKRRSLESLGLLAAGLAHEIRNPLGAIRGYTQLAHEQADNDQAKDRAALMLQELDRVSERLEEFLGFARKRKLKIQPTDLAELAHQTASLLKSDTEAASIELAVDAPSQPVVVHGDPAQLKELLLNLMLNAVEACEDGDRIDVMVSGGGSGAKIVIRDTGCGIEPEDLPRLLEPYFTTKDSGSGLGLAISRRIAEDHGAFLTVENAEANGAVATIRFPGEHRPLPDAGASETTQGS